MESLRGRGGILVGLFVAIMVASIAAFISDLDVLDYLKNLEAGGVADQVAAEAIDNREAVIGLVQGSLEILCTIVFLMWFHRAHKNLGALGIGGLEYTPGWAVGGFFVPILNVARPCQVMREVWSGSAFLSQGVDPARWKTVRPAPLVAIWWVLFLATWTLGRTATRISIRADGLEELIDATQLVAASDLLDIPAALAGLLLVRRVTRLQEDIRESLLPQA